MIAAVAIRAIVALVTFAAGAMATSSAFAFSIELRGAAPLRIERQRQYALKPPEKRSIEPASEAIRERLLSVGAHDGAPIFIRLFKAESELEIWVLARTKFVLFKRYRICFWSGTLGPKLNEGDGQTPEGFYTITRRRLHWSRRWARSLNIGYPNAFDRRHGRTGSHILIHGGCSSIGCFSMTNAVMSEIHHLVKSAIRRGQARVHVHAFPFRMTEANFRRHRAPRWTPYWRDLQAGYDAFERSRLPPQIGVCRNRYVVRTAPSIIAGDPGAIRALDGPRRRYAARGPIDLPAGSDWQCQPQTRSVTGPNSGPNSEPAPKTGVGRSSGLPQNFTAASASLTHLVTRHRRGRRSRR